MLSALRLSAKAGKAELKGRTARKRSFLIRQRHKRRSSPVEATHRNLKIAVVGIPKTIADDVMFVNRSFGYFTAISRAKDIIDSASAS